MEARTGFATQCEILERAYEAFNRRDIDGALRTMAPDVEWPNGMNGGTVHGRQGVRDYWTRQWSIISPRVNPLSFVLTEDGRIEVRVHQVVRDLEGALIADQIVWHTYTIKGGLIRSMEIRK